MSPLSQQCAHTKARKKAEHNSPAHISLICATILFFFSQVIEYFPPIPMNPSYNGRFARHSSKPKVQWVKKGETSATSTTTGAKQLSRAHAHSASANFKAESVDFFGLLPKDIVQHILDYLLIHEVVVLSSVNKWYAKHARVHTLAHARTRSSPPLNRIHLWHATFAVHFTP